MSENDYGIKEKMLLDLFFKKDFSQEEYKESLSCINYFTGKGLNVIDNSKIAKYVYHNPVEKDKELFKRINERVDILIGDLNDSGKLFMVNTINSIDLILEQKKYINREFITETMSSLKDSVVESEKQLNKSSDTLSAVSNDMKNMKEEIKEYDTRSSDIKKRLNSVEDIRHNIYTDFIAILGIFTAITFASFGGIQLLGSIFKNISEISNTKIFIGEIFICASIFGLVMYGIIVTLFIGIIKVMSITRTNPQNGDYLFDKEFTISIVLFLLVLLIVGCIFLLSV